MSLFSVAAGGVYQQKFCRGVDFRATAALQNAACVAPVVVLAALMPFTVTNPWKAAGAVAAVVLLNATLCMTMYVRAVNDYGAAAVAMLFAVIPAVAGLLSWLMLGQRPDIGIAVGLVARRGGLLAQRAGSRRQRQDASVADGGHHAGQLTGDVGAGRLIDELGDSSGLVFGDPGAQLLRGPAEGELRKQVGGQRDRLLVHRGEPHQVAFVGDEVTLVGRNGLDRGHPFAAARKRGARRRRRCVRTGRGTRRPDRARPVPGPAALCTSSPSSRTVPNWSSE